jgi:transposase-like protein
MPKCPKCGSEDVRKSGFKLLSGRKAQQYQCKKCGRVFYSDLLSISKKSLRKEMEDVKLYKRKK